MASVPSGSCFSSSPGDIDTDKDFANSRFRRCSMSSGRRSLFELAIEPAIVLGFVWSLSVSVVVIPALRSKKTTYFR